MKIKIEDLRNIKSLEFEIPPPGIWVLTGKNGSGKSTLLGALWRIKEPNAFQRYFPSSSIKELDNHEGASISYIIDKEEYVTYKRRKTRWPPTPKKNSKILDRFGYNKVLLITVDEKRIFPRKEEFPDNIRRLRKADQFIIDGTNETFKTTKFDNLKVLNITTGKNPAYLIKVNNEKIYSEKNFSLGELNVVKLLERLAKIKNEKGALILIDEFDMALHPTAQINLIEVLEKYAEESGHTIIFSTHSASIIKYIDSKNILYLRNTGERIEVVKNPMLHEILEDLSSDIHLTEGLRVFCEDDLAQRFIEVAYIRYTNKQKLNPITFKPLICGSWTHVIDRARETNREGGKFIAIPDKDIEENENYENMIHDFKKNVKPLPITPELAIATYYSENKDHFTEMIHEEIKNSGIPISLGDLKERLKDIIIHKNHLKKLKFGKNGERRDAAKKIVKEIQNGLKSMSFDIDSKSVLIGATINIEFQNKKQYRKWCEVMSPLHKLLENT